MLVVGCSCSHIARMRSSEAIALLHLPRSCTHPTLRIYSTRELVNRSINYRWNLATTKIEPVGNKVKTRKNCVTHIETFHFTLQKQTNVHFKDGIVIEMYPYVYRYFRWPRFANDCWSQIFTAYSSSAPDFRYARRTSAFNLKRKLIAKIQNTSETSKSERVL